jgi:hypothetical protein
MYFQTFSYTASTNVHTALWVFNLQYTGLYIYSDTAGTWAIYTNVSTHTHTYICTSIQVYTSDLKRNVPRDLPPSFFLTWIHSYRGFRTYSEIR